MEIPLSACKVMRYVCNNDGSGYLQSGSAHRRRTLAYLQSRDEPIKVLGSSHMTK